MRFEHANLKTLYLTYIIVYFNLISTYRKLFVRNGTGWMVILSPGVSNAFKGKLDHHLRNVRRYFQAFAFPLLMAICPRTHLLSYLTALSQEILWIWNICINYIAPIKGLEFHLKMRKNLLAAGATTQVYSRGAYRAIAPQTICCFGCRDWENIRWVGWEGREREGEWGNVKRRILKGSLTSLEDKLSRDFWYLKVNIGCKLPIK